MKPVSVTMQAFGSYLKRTTVDFTALGDDAIFLITGATGGGKTTILDAMCFALYCKATGGRRSWGSMRCAAAPVGTETMVDFVFALAGKTYRFTRSQTLYEARGGALKTKETHECYCQKDGEWELLLAGAESRVREKAEEILGLTCEQFSQVIVLPQGDFLKLLLSSSKDKARMFETLFATGRWERAARNLKELAAELGQKAGELEAAKRSVLEREHVETIPQLEERETALKEDWEKAKAARDAAEKALQAHSDALRAAEGLAGRFSALEEQRAKLKNLELRREEMAKNRQTLALARQAAGVYPYYGAFQSAQKDAPAKRRACEAAEQRCREAEAARQGALRQLPLAEQARAALPKLAQEEARLQTARESADKLRETQKRRADGARRMAGLEKRKGAAQLRLETAARQLADGNAYIEEAQKQIALLPTLLTEVQRLMDEDAAAGLAAGLQEGKPCPVCGSVHHPRPARQDERLKEAQAALQQARKAAGLMENARKRLQQRRAEHDRAREECAACAEAIASLHSEQEALAASERETLDKLGELRELSAIDRRLADVRTKAAQNTQTAQKIEARASAAQSAAAAAKASLDGAAAAFREAREALGTAQERLQRAAAEAGLPQDADYAAMLLPPERVKQLEQTIQAYDTAAESARQQKDALEQELAGRQAPDLAALREAQKQAQGAAAQAAKALGGLEQAVQSARESLARLRKLEQTGKELEESYGRASRLAALLSGKNGLKVPLHQFVLGVMLDDILTSANQFFATLSSGRYSLSRVVGSSGGNALAGLDLEVFDAYTGGTRAVETLSGGELFLASLSLAFGLSDVVQSYSGGVHLDSLFIDEGFGSLDQETLDTAMKALAQLQRMGRTIGIISHVSELKNRIAGQVVVGKDADGGSTATVKLL